MAYSDRLWDGYSDPDSLPKAAAKANIVDMSEVPVATPPVTVFPISQGEKQLLKPSKKCRASTLKELHDLSSDSGSDYLSLSQGEMSEDWYFRRWAGRGPNPSPSLFASSFEAMLRFHY